MLEEQRGFIHSVSPYLGCWFALQWTATSPGPRSQKSSGGWGRAVGEGGRAAARPGRPHISREVAWCSRWSVQHVALKYLRDSPWKTCTFCTYVHSVYNNLVYSL